MNLKVMTLIALGVIFFAHAESKPKKDSQKASAKKVAVDLDQITKKYRQSNYVKMDVKKQVRSEVLGKETDYTGVIYLSKNKFRWNTTKPERSEVIFDGETIWSIQFPPEELPGPVQVAKSKLSKNSKRQIFISTLFAENGIDKNFKISKQEKNGDLVQFYLLPLSKELGVQALNVTANVKSKKITALFFEDDLGNKTQLNFENIEFFTKPAKEIFKYSPPKDAQVTNL